MNLTQVSLAKKRATYRCRISCGAVEAQGQRTFGQFRLARQGDL